MLRSNQTITHDPTYDDVWVEDGYCQVLVGHTYVVSDSGYEYSAFEPERDEARAAHLLDHYQRLLTDDPRWIEDNWCRRTIYGGTAWGSEDELELAQADWEAEYGPGAPMPFEMASRFHMA